MSHARAAVELGDVVVKLLIAEADSSRVVRVQLVDLARLEVDAIDATARLGTTLT